jgi:uncharacterized membrane protein
LNIKIAVKEKLIIVLKGVALGVANKVPGISGGLVAFVLGFYEEFIDSLQKFNVEGVKLIKQGEFKIFYRHINGQFLGLLLFGMIVSYFSVSRILDYLLNHYEIYVWSLFFGLIIGSLLFIYRRVESLKLETFFWTLLGFIFGLSLSLITPAGQNENLFFVFICGIVSVVGMTLPGFSGSFILMLMGNYVLLLVDSVNALYITLSNLFLGKFEILTDPYLCKMLKILLVFSFGSLVGLILFSNILKFVLKKYKNKTLSIIMGFIAGSLGVVWPWKNKIYKSNPNGEFIIDSFNNKQIIDYNHYLPNLSTETYLGIVYILLGIIIVFIIDNSEETKKSSL